MSAAVLTPLCDDPNCAAQPAPGSHLCDKHEPLLCVVCVEPVPHRDPIRLDGAPHCAECAWRNTGEDVR